MIGCECPQMHVSMLTLSHGEVYTTRPGIIKHVPGVSIAVGNLI